MELPWAWIYLVPINSSLTEGLLRDKISTNWKKGGGEKENFAVTMGMEEKKPGLAGFNYGLNLNFIGLQLNGYGTLGVNH